MMQEMLTQQQYNAKKTKCIYKDQLNHHYKLIFQLTLKILGSERLSEAPVPEFSSSKLDLTRNPTDFEFTDNQIRH